MSLELWQKCMELLQDELPLQQFNTWLRPLKVMADDDALCLLAPNRFVLDWIKDKFLSRIEEVLDELSAGHPPDIALAVATKKPSFTKDSGYSLKREVSAKKKGDDSCRLEAQSVLAHSPAQEHYLDPLKGKSSLFRARHNRKINSNSTDDCNMQKSLDLGEEQEMGNEKTKLDSHEKRVLQHTGNELNMLSNQFSIEELAQKDQEEVLHFHNPLRYGQSALSAISADNNIKPELFGADMEQKSSSVIVEKTQEKEAVQFKPHLKNTMMTKLGRQSVTREDSSRQPRRQVDVEGGIRHHSSLNNNFTFDSFVEGKSNQLALAAAKQIVENPGTAYNPLFLYGGVGLGKTHLMHAVGNYLMQKNNKSMVVYLHSERFVADMVKALQLNAINDFKRYYRSVDALLIDDIQFFSGKDRSQEEFFHTFNALLEGGQQIILTCDRYPKEINGLEERLKSRFGWGLTVAVEPPELETRVAILMKKAEQANIILPSDAAFFIAQRLRSNVRELEGALKRVVASAHFMGVPIDINLIREALKDLLALQEKMISIDNIQKTVAEYYQIKMVDILSKTRTRVVARPRQISMALAKKLTSHSLPEIGDAHGGRDHTTVLHACRKIKELIYKDNDIANDYQHLLKLLTN